MTAPGLPADAIEAAHEATSCRLGEPGWTDLLYKSPQQLIDIALAAAAPAIAAQAAAAERERIAVHLAAKRDSFRGTAEMLAHQGNEMRLEYHAVADTFDDVLKFLRQGGDTP